MLVRVRKVVGSCGMEECRMATNTFALDFYEMFLSRLLVGTLLHVAINLDQHRLGGSALAQCFSQLGNVPPDLDSPATLVSCFQVTQGLLQGMCQLREG